ncbi:MAG: ShlB/FhaC/HecB family hemolysin secretion/activation protein [Oceanospirillaceae bacterium]|nr:ShlB/FhaC/HecB family hemolysin secretion/activation protein [Oceanospirillaceae bacterium]MCP5351177.1 ShlB/FhaC/HecB family hemolysin secretion/activation protein [Oceanospirillaceae bacterium]
MLRLFALLLLLLSLPCSAAQGVWVESIRLQGFIAHPAQGITQNDLLDHIDRWRLAYKPIMQLSELDEIVHQINNYYIDHGFTFVRAYLPEQKVQRGVVTIGIREDVLSEVVFRQDADAVVGTYKHTFKRMVGRPVYKPAIEEALLLLNDNPAYTAFAFFSKGNGDNESRLNINVQEADAITARIGADNYGSKATGENRIWLHTGWSNPFNSGHQIRLALTAAQTDQNNLFGTLSYDIPLSARWLQQLSWSHQQYTLGQDLESLEIHGESDVYSLSWTYKPLRSMALTHQHSFTLAARSSQLQSDVIIGLFDQQESSYAAGWSWSRSAYNLEDGDHLATTLGLDAIHVPAADGSNEPTRTLGKFSIGLQQGFTLGRHLPWLRSVLINRLNIQASQHPLPGIDKLPLSGPYGVRAMPANSLNVDDGAIWQMELVYRNTALLGRLEPFLFFDAAAGDRYAGVQDKVSGYFAGGGLGLKATLWHGLSFNLTAGNATAAKLEDSDLEKPATVFGQLSYTWE